MQAFQNREDTTPVPKASAPAQFRARRDARAARAAARDASSAPAPRPARQKVLVLRARVEEIGTDRLRPEPLPDPSGRTLLDAVGSREVIATALRKLARQLDPPWWQFWHRPR